MHEYFHEILIILFTVLIKDKIFKLYSHILYNKHKQKLHYYWLYCTYILNIFNIIFY